MEYMTKKINQGSENQNRPNADFQSFSISGDNSKGNKRNKEQRNKTE